MAGRDQVWQLVGFSAAHPWFWLSLLGGLGLMIGSFLNVVIHRLPLMLEAQWQRDARWLLGLAITAPPEPVTLVWPRSQCVHCHQPLALRDVLPVVGWGVLRGYSRCCQRAISWRYPLIEVLTALLFVVAGLLWPPGGALFGVLVLIAFLIALTGIDAETFLLPDALTLPLLWIGLCCNLTGTFVSLESAVIGAMAGYFFLWTLARLSAALISKETLGQGDAKLLAALGAWLGWQALPLVVLIAAVTGLLVVGSWRWYCGNENCQPLALGPWLALGGGVVMLI